MYLLKLTGTFARYLMTGSLQIKQTYLRILIILLILTGSLQKICICSESDDFENRLQTAIKQAEHELQAEKVRIQNELQIREDELEQILTECNTLSDEVVERNISIAQKQNQLQQIRKQRETLWLNHIRFQEDLTQMKAICREIKSELGELLGILPVSEYRKSQLEELSKLNESLAQEKYELIIPSVFRLFESVLIESRTTSVYPADILDTQGMPQSVTMLRIGMSLFAYNIAGTLKTALAISAPYQQDGFRWYEGLSKNMQQSIVNAVNKIQNNDGVYTFPIDVTGTMTLTTNISDKSIEGRLRAGGIVMYPLTFVAFCLLVLIVERMFILLRERRHSIQFCEQILELCYKENFEKAEKLAKKKKGIVSRILSVCLTNRHRSPTVLDDAIQEAFLHELPRLERFLPSIRMLSTVAPMLGLLGTVTGIIATFDMISIAGGGKPQLLAGGIAEALITTATGLSIAIPGLLAHSYLSSRIEGLIADAERFAASLSNVLKQKQPSL